MLNDTFNSTISINLKLRIKHENAPYFQTLMEEDFSVTLELICLVSNIKKEVSIVLDSFLSLLIKYETKKTHNMLSLMLDVWFKCLHLVSSFIGCEQRIAIIEEYDTRFLYPMLLKCYHHLTSSGWI